MTDDLLATLRAGVPASVAADLSDSRAAAVSSAASAVLAASATAVRGTPAIPAAPDACSVRVVVNGVGLHVVQAGPQDGPLVLLLHGCPEFWWGWRHQIGALAGAGFRVWAPDQRGYGSSDRPRGVRHYRIDRLMEDAAALIGAAGRERASVVGHDWGGGVAWWLALHRPELVERLAILNAPHPLVMRRALLASPRQMARSWYMLLFALPWLPEALFGARDGALWARALRQSSRPGTFSDAVLAPYRRSWAQPGALHAMFDWYRGLVGQGAPAMERVTMPALLVWGTGDLALGRALASPSIAHCDDGRLQLLEEATHWVQHEEPARVNALLLQHLRSASHDHG